MSELLSMKGKRVLVTGASSGLGAHFATVLAGAGADLVLAARRVEKLEHTALAVRELGQEAEVVPLDVTDWDGVGRAFEAMPAVDVVVNNAGTGRNGRTDELSEEDWDAVVDTNLKGVAAVARHALRRWVSEEREGIIINIASILGLRVSQQLASYIASKSAVVALTRSIALDYARHGIRCNAICPGYFETDLNSEWLNSEGGKRQIQGVPFRRTGQLHELDGPLLLLASNASSFMSGSILVVDGAHLCTTL